MRVMSESFHCAKLWGAVEAVKRVTGVERVKGVLTGFESFDGVLLTEPGGSV